MSKKNFDIVYHTLTIADKKACLYFIDGFTKDEILLRLMQDFASVKPDSFPSSAHDFAKQYVHYGETTVETDDKKYLYTAPLRPLLSFNRRV